jgi:hypothetical protein
MPRKKHFDFTPEILTKIEYHLGCGVTISQIANVLGICTDYLLKMRKKYPELDACIKRGKDRGISLVAGKLFAGAMKGDKTLIIFYLKCHGGGAWRESAVDSGYIPPVKNSESPLTQKKLSEFTTDPNEAARIYKKLMEGS